MRKTKKRHKGLFVVFEGIDGSGKSTQARLLLDRLKKAKTAASFIHFPQYGKKSAGLVEEYLAGAYGTADQVGPYQASMLYSVDRYDASFRIRGWMGDGRVVVADRYIGSNVGHQGGKISSSRRREDFFRWLYDLEYRIFEIPRPDISFFLHMPPKIAKKLRRNDATRGKKDIHERKLSHLEGADRAYRHAVKVFPKAYRTIECATEKGAPRDPKDIHEEIWSALTGKYHL